MSNIVLNELNRVTKKSYVSVTSGLQQIGISKATFYKKLSEGWSIERVISTCSKPTNGRKYWTPREVKYIKENAGYLSAPEMAKHLNRTAVSVHKKCRTLRLSTNTTTERRLAAEQTLLCKILMDNGMCATDIHAALFPYVPYKDFIKLLEV